RHALHAAAERRHRTFADFVGGERRDHGQAAALFRCAAARRPRRRSWTRRSGGAAPCRAAIVVVSLQRQRPMRRTTRSCRLDLVFAEPLLGDLVGLALGFLVVAATL